jgi:hypothetical protein
MQHYRLGIEPAWPGTKGEGLNLSWLGRPGQGARSLGRSALPGLFTQSYDYVKEAGELEGVPIQIWAVKTLTGRWLQTPPPGQRLFKNELEAEGLTVKGALTSELPWRLQNAVLLYRKRVWNLGQLQPGARVVLPGFSTKMLPSWLEAAASGEIGRRGHGDPYPGPPQELIWRMSFYHDLPHAESEHHEYLNYVDQSWRMNFPEAILLAQVADQDGPAEKLNQAGWPGSRFQHFAPALAGHMRHSMVVRVFLPVAHGAGRGP